MSLQQDKGKRTERDECASCKPGAWRRRLGVARLGAPECPAESCRWRLLHSHGFCSPSHSRVAQRSAGQNWKCWGPMAVHALTLHFQLWGCSQLSLLEKVNLQIGDSLGWRDLACRGHRFEVSGEAPWDDVLSGSQWERGAICQDIMNGKGVCMET